MRKESKHEERVALARVQGYHEGGSWSGENYAFMGFQDRRYFTSDRYIRLTENFERPDGQPLQGFGLEIETECSRITDSDVLAEVYNSIIFKHFPEGLFKMQHDGSLGGQSSAECITQVMTKAFIRNHYKDFKLMYNTYFRAFGIGCTSGRCGMHTNISNAVFGKTKKAQDEAIRKLYYIVNRHFDLCCKLLNRTGSTTYCSRMSFNDAKTMELSGHGSDHYVCFNLGHYDAGRIELRLVGGQKDFGCFRNTMESIFFLCDRVRKISWSDCDNVTKIFEGCNQYVYDRLRTKCDLSTEALAAIANTVQREELL